MSDEIKELENWLAVSEAAQLSGYGMDWIRELAGSGKIESVKKGHTLLINRQSLLEYMDKKTQLN